MSDDAPLPITREQIMDAMLFAVGQSRSGLPDDGEMREAVDDATHHQLPDEALERLTHMMVQLLNQGTSALKAPKRLHPGEGRVRTLT
jgi:hypothetical protein